MREIVSRIIFICVKELKHFLAETHLKNRQLIKVLAETCVFWKGIKTKTMMKVSSHVQIFND
jgi:hypothetical protein